MTRKDETYLFDLLERIRDETHENNVMLKQICKVINMWLRNANAENENDFGRNVLANLVSNIVDIKKFKRK